MSARVAGFRVLRGLIRLAGVVGEGLHAYIPRPRSLARWTFGSGRHPFTVKKRVRFSHGSLSLFAHKNSKIGILRSFGDCRWLGVTDPQNGT
jgi:hypothetical protein